MKTKELDYFLPKELIAQKPAEPRESAKLLYFNRETKEKKDLKIENFPDLLSGNDCLVINVASVLKARLFGKNSKEKEREIFLLKKVDNNKNIWEVLVKGSVKEGEVINFPQNVSAKIEKSLEGGSFLVSFSVSSELFDNYLEKIGHVPVPPYIGREPDSHEYETSYADPKEKRSVAAPTAGFHLTKNILERLREKGVQIEKVVLDVGLGTFQPIRTGNLEDHKIHEENIHLSPETASRINEAIKAGKRIMAVGTTTLRVLESAATVEGFVSPLEGPTSLFITPGYNFKVVKALLTNFHLPASSLLALVSAFVGSVPETLSVYKEAVDKKYRFFSFGDAMFIE